MIESIFLWIMSVGFITLVLGSEQEKTIYNGISILLWIIVLGAHFYIVIPSTTVDYWEVAMLPLSLAFIFINVIIIIIDYISDTRMNRITHR